MCSWDEKASSKIQKALEQEILAFIGDAQKVGHNSANVVCHLSASASHCHKFGVPDISRPGTDSSGGCRISRRRVLIHYCVRKVLKPHPLLI